MAAPEVLRALGAADLFAVLDEEVRSELAAHCQVRRFRRGQNLMVEGDLAESLLVVAEGRLKVVTESPEGDELLLGTVEPGEAVGELALLDAGRRSASVHALTDGSAVVVPAEQFWKLVRSHNEFVEHLLQLLARRVRHLTREAASLVFLDLPRRVARVLLELGQPASERVDLALTQTELANRVGGTRQSVNAALGHFERRGWIVREGRGLRLRDAAALTRFVGE